LHRHQLAEVDTSTLPVIVPGQISSFFFEARPARLEIDHGPEKNGEKTAARRDIELAGAE
jgi:hypothetical protein